MHDYLDEHQIKAVEALLELKRICEKHDIHFYLLAGTTLGAVRHEGMIPWDDDVDVGLLVEDLIKLQAVIQDELNPELGFEYAALEVEPGFPRLFGKILYNRQSCVDLFLIAKWTNNNFRGHIHWNIMRFCVESYYDSIGYTKPKVVANTDPKDPILEKLNTVDNRLDEQEASQENEALAESIQPVESENHTHKFSRQFKNSLKAVFHIPSNKYGKQLPSQKKKLYTARMSLFRLTILNRKQQLKDLFNPRNLSNTVRFIIYKCCFFLKTEDYIRLARWNEDFFGRHGYDCYANIYSIYGMKKERIKKEWIENTSYVTFEGEKFMTVGDTDAYLTHLYGNYMQLPPEEKRIKARHAEVYKRPNK